MAPEPVHRYTGSSQRLPAAAGRAILDVCGVVARACGQHDLDWEYTVRRRPSGRGGVQGCWLVIWLADQPPFDGELPRSDDLQAEAHALADLRAAGGVRIGPLRVSRGWNGITNVSVAIDWDG